MPETFVVTPATRPGPLNVVGEQITVLAPGPELVVTKSSARQARKAADLLRTAILGMSPSTW
jgi:hypothetical protein